MTMAQPGILWWHKYGTLAQAVVAVLEPVYLATYRSNTQQWVKAALQTAGVTPPDCKLGKT
jgi:hypothetical protein